MRVLIVNRHFASDHVPTGRMMGDLCRALVAQGHQPVVLTARSSYTETAEAAATVAGARVVYVATFGERYRLVSWLLFLLQAMVRVPFMRWDRCIVLTDPPFLGAVTLLMRPFARVMPRVFWWTMDLYPEILVSSGRLAEQNALHGMLRRLNSAIIKRMGGFILLGDCQVERMRAYPSWNGRDCLIVPPWDLRPIERVETANNRFLEKYGLTGKKIALYAGNLGEGHTFEPLVRAARCLAENRRDDWKLVFVIRGSKKQQLIEVSRGLPAVVILDYQPVEWTSDLLWSAHVHLITINDQSKGLVVPSKLYGVLQTDAPVLFMGPQDADTAQEIARYRAGESLEGTCRGAEIVEALDRLYARRAEIIAGRLPADTTGPAQIAAFVTRDATGRGAA